MSGGTSDPRATSPGGHLTRWDRWHSDTVSMDDEEVSSSCDVMIYDSSIQQPECTSLAILSGVFTLSPLKVIPVTTLDEKVRR